MNYTYLIFVVLSLIGAVLYEISRIYRRAHNMPKKGKKFCKECGKEVKKDKYEHSYSDETKQKYQHLCEDCMQKVLLKEYKKKHGDK